MNGKGSRDRTSNWKRYRRNFDRVFPKRARKAKTDLVAWSFKGTLVVPKPRANVEITIPEEFRWHNIAHRYFVSEQALRDELDLPTGKLTRKRIEAAIKRKMETGA